MLDTASQLHSAHVDRARAMQRLAKTKSKQVSKAERDDLLLWTINHRRELSPSTRFNLSTHLYLAGLYKEERRDICVKKSGQSGVSEYAIGRSFYVCDEVKGNVLYIMPTNEDVSDFSQMRFGPALDASAYLSKVVADASKGTSHGADRVTMKRVRDNFIVFRFARIDKDGKARQLKSVPADMVVLDELDEMDPRVVEMADKRLGHSDLKWKLFISTPTYANFGIDAQWNLSDQRLWHVPCPSCGKYQVMSIENVIIERDDLGRPIEWHGRKNGRAYAACDYCDSELDRFANGVWVPTFRDRDMAGFHITKLFDPRSDLLAIVLGLQTVNQSKIKEIFNQDLGETHTPEGGRLTDEIIDACKLEYAAGPQPDIETFAGIDVGHLFNIVIRGTPDRFGRRRKLYAGAVTSEQEVVRLLRIYNVKSFVIDGLPETRASRRIQSAFPKGVGWLAYYTLPDEGKKQDWFAFNKDERIVSLSRTLSLDATYERFYEQTNLLPAVVDDEYVKQLKAPVRVMQKRSKNQEVPIYVEDGPDHYAHAENYCNAAYNRPSGMAVGKARVTTAEDMGL